ncbi:MAG: isochorismatase family protein [Rhodoblastus sp.]|nr:MAG: isochorismatase family protein [Rhodoblastus sp.]
MSDAVLLVIDAQESFRRRPYFVGDDLPRYLAEQNRLIAGAKAAGVAVAQIFHVEEDGPFSKACGHVRPLEGLVVTPDVVFEKRRHSALVGTGLDVWLTQRGARRVIVSGVRTEQCCETTARHASDLGWEVTFCTPATLTFPMKGADGRLWSAAEIAASVELALEGRFARVVGVDEALASAA